MELAIPADARTAPGHPGYFVTPVGEVWSLLGPRSPRRRAVYITWRGYEALKLRTPDGTFRAATIHALVALTFLGPRPPGMTINHRDGNKRNNRADNLEYVPGEANRRHAVTAGLYSLTAPFKLSRTKASEIRERRAAGESLRSLARRFGVCKGSIQDVLGGRSYAEAP